MVPENPKRSTDDELIERREPVWYNVPAPARFRFAGVVLGVRGRHAGVVLKDDLLAEIALYLPDAERAHASLEPQHVSGSGV